MQTSPPAENKVQDTRGCDGDPGGLWIPRDTGDLQVLSTQPWGDAQLHGLTASFHAGEAVHKHTELSLGSRGSQDTRAGRQAALPETPTDPATKCLTR